MSEPQQESLHFLDYWRVIRSRKEIVISVFLLVVLTGVLITHSLPKVYTASVLIRLNSEDSTSGSIFPNDVRGRYDPFKLRTEFQIIQSRPVIEEVVRRLDLNSKLGRAYGYLDALGDKSFEQTCKLLSKSMKVQQYRDTNLIEVQLYLSEPRESVVQVVADTANAVADVYRNQDLRRSREGMERLIEALRQSLEEQRTRVKNADMHVEEIRQRYQLNLLSTTTDSTLPKMNIARLEGMRLTLMLEVEDKKARYDKVMKLSPEQLLDAVPYMAGEAASAAAGLVADKRRAEVELSRLFDSLGPKHPNVIKVQSTVTEMQAKIVDALRGLKSGMQTDYEAAKAKLDAVDKRLDEQKITERNTESQGYREFTAATEDLVHAKRIRDTLEAKYLQEKINLGIPKTAVDVVQPALPPREDDPVSPDPLLNLILSIILGLGVGIGLAYFVEYLDTSVKTIDDVEKHLGLPVLGVVPQKVKPFSESGFDSAYAEAYRVLRTNIQFSKKWSGGKALCVTSGSVGEGKSLTLFNLAYICAQLGDKVIIVNADLHRPRQHKILGVSNRPGVANILVGEATLDQSILQTKVPNLHLLPSGKLAAGVHGLLDTRKMKDLVGQLKQRYGLILFDAPPMIGVSDTSLIVREMDGVLLVVQHRKYPRSVSLRAKSMAEHLGANLIGVVLNNINISRDYSYYYYHQHYYYYPRHSGGKESAPEKTKS